MTRVEDVMCEFLSAIVMESGDVLCDPEHTDSHEDLLLDHHVRDGHAQRGRFVRIEFTPPDAREQIADLAQWTAKVDETEVPDWFDAASARQKLEAIARRMIVNDERDLLLGGCWILVGKANVKRVLNARISLMVGSSRVGELYDSSQVGVLYDSSRVGELYGSSQVGELYGSSRVGELYGSSQVVKDLRVK